MKKIMDFMKDNEKWLFFTMCLILFAFLSIVVLKGMTTGFDERCYLTVSSIIPSNISGLLKCITNLANKYWLIGLSVLLIIVMRNKKMAISIFVNLAISYLTNQMVKHIVQRPRPIGFRLVEETGYSFPSGHSMVSMAFYGFLIFLIYKSVKNKYLKFSLISLLSIIILSVGISRIYLGVHFASDVIAGFVLGIVYLIVFVSVWENVSDSKENVELKDTN